MPILMYAKYCPDLSGLKFYYPFLYGKLGKSHTVMYIEFFRYVRLEWNHRFDTDIEASCSVSLLDIAVTH